MGLLTLVYVLTLVSVYGSVAIKAIMESARVSIGRNECCGKIKVAGKEGVYSANLSSGDSSPICMCTQCNHSSNHRMGEAESHMP